MNKIKIVVLSLAINLCCVANASEKMSGESHGIKYPAGWQNWSTIAVSKRTDNNTLRLILGNKIAVKAARSGNVNPWPDGSDQWGQSRMPLS